MVPTGCRWIILAILLVRQATRLADKVVVAAVHLHQVAFVVDRHMAPVVAAEVVAIKVLEEVHKVLEEVHKVSEEVHKVSEEVHKVLEEAHKVLEEAHKVLEGVHKGLEEVHKGLPPVHHGVPHQVRLCLAHILTPRLRNPK
jgi:uncharacterized coiled-coil DUF342 family protein